MKSEWIKEGQRIEQKALQRCARIVRTGARDVRIEWEPNGHGVTVPVSTIRQCWRPVDEPRGIVHRVVAWWGLHARWRAAGLLWVLRHPRRTMAALERFVLEQQVSDAMRLRLDAARRRNVN